MEDLLPRFDFCVFDLETTGLSPGEDTGIIEVGAVRIDGGSNEQTFQRLADPGHSIPGEITEITGLSDEDIQDATPSPAVVEEFLDFAEGSILIAHNARFDLSFLNHCAPEQIDHDYIDTLRLSRQLISAESHSLSALVERFDLSLDRAHRALDDALATRDLFYHLTQKITRPEDYFRCNLPPVLLDEAPVEVPRPDKSFNGHLSDRDWILYGLYELDASIGVTKLAKILCGSNSKDIERYTSIDAYGQRSNYTQSEMKATIKETIAEDYIEQSSDPYPVLNLTEDGIQQLIDLSA